MKNVRKALILIMGFCMLLGTIPFSGMHVYAETSTGEVTRLEWLKALTETFEMTVAEDNYPDNYYSDIDASSPDYYDVMLATEFGLIDVEAGDPLRPDDAATREFAAHTLNLCLGYVPDEEMEYTFNEVSDVTYATDIQIAINKGWLTLNAGNFLPEQGITTAEKDHMIAVAKEVIASDEIDYDYENQFQIKEGVIVVPESVEAVLTDDNELTLYDCSLEIPENSIFVVFTEGLPIAKKALSVVSNSGNKVITVDDVEMEEAFDSLDVQGSIDADLTKTQVLDDNVEVTYIVGGTEEENYDDGISYSSLEEIENPKEVTAVITTKEIEIPNYYSNNDEDEAIKDLNDGFVTFSFKITNVKVDYKMTLYEAYVMISGNITFSCNIAGHETEIPYFENPFTRVPIGGIGYFAPTAEGKVNGKISMALYNTFSIGVKWSVVDRLRLVASFSADSFSISANAEASLGIKIAVGIDTGVVDANLYLKGGAKVALKITPYLDGLEPQRCTHISAYMYASAGGSVEFRLFKFKVKGDLPFEIYNEKNSPVKLAWHIEDGQTVPACTRSGNSSGDESSGSGSGAGTGSSTGGQKYKYYTPIDSRFTCIGINSGVSSTGQPFKLFDYTLDDGGQATITKYYGRVSALTIPETIDGHTVVGIANGVFQNNSRLIMVLMPDTITSVGNYAFRNCSNLSNVVLSKSLKILGYSAFDNCDSLTDIEIPKSLQRVTSSFTDGAFRNCDNLRNVTFEEGTTHIATYLFAYCPGIEEITIPNTVTEIDDYAFQSCTNLKKVSLSNSLTSIGNNAFEDCSNLSNVILPKTLVTLGYSAFRNCDSLTDIEIPKSLQRVTSSLTLDGAFRNCDNLRNVTFEKGTTHIATYLFAYCPGIEEITIPNTVTAIDADAFLSCTNLKKVVLPDSLTTISGSAFQNCTSLEEITIPNSVTRMGTYVFAGCTSLKNVKLPNSRKNITEGTFQNCSSLTSIELPDSVTNIADYAFQNNTALEEVKYGNQIATIGNYAFYNCDALKSFTIPDSVSSMGTYCFADCELLKDVTLGSGLTQIGSYTFNLCPSLQKVVLPYRMATVSANAFTNCTALTELTIPRATTSIASNAFSYPTKMTVYGVPGTYAQTWSDSVGATFVSQEKPATAVALDQTALIINKGKTASLVMTVTPADFTDEYSWKSSNETVATVSSNGVITAKATGTATIRVTVGSVSVSCKVTVVQPVTGISLNKTTLSMDAESIYTLTATVSPTSANDRSVTWSSSDETVATVNQTGVVTALSKGTAVITVTANDGSGISRSCTVTVTNTLYRCGNVTELESPHNYANNCTDIWVYTLSGAKRIAVTFDARTEMEDEFDYLYLYDGSGSQIGCYTGTELAGQTLILNGDTLKLKMDSDASGNAWGFKVTSVTEYCEHTYAGSWSSDETGHWHAATCGHDVRADEAAHSGTDWIVDLEATRTAAGARHKECSVCKRVLESEEIPRLKTPAEIKTEELNEAVSGILGAAEALDSVAEEATTEEKIQSVEAVLGQVETISSAAQLGEIGIVPADSAVAEAARLSSVEAKIAELLGTSVTVESREDNPALVLPTVQNALLSVPAGENATIWVAEVEIPGTLNVAHENAYALTLEMYDASEEKLPLKAPVAVTIQIPSNIDTSGEVVIYHFHEGAENYAERIPVHFNGDGTLTFVTGSFSSFVLANAPAGYALSGTIKSFGSDGSAQVRVGLYTQEGDEVTSDTVAVTGSVTGYTSEYRFEEVEPGNYTLKVSKGSHVTREYAVTIGEDDAEQNGEIHLRGDVDGDGRITSRDNLLIYNHIAKKKQLEEYDFLVADVDTDSRITSRDNLLIYNHIAKKALLW